VDPNLQHIGITVGSDQQDLSGKIMTLYIPYMVKDKTHPLS